MNQSKSQSSFIRLLRSVLKDNGFHCRGSKCTAPSGELTLEISLRNRWGWLIPDIYIELSDAEAGELLQGDLRFLLPGYFELRADLSDEELLSMSGDTETRVRRLFVEELIPLVLSWTDRNYFLNQVDAGRFADSGIYVHAIAKLRAKVSDIRTPR